MSIEARKLSLIQQLSLIQKETLLDKVEALLNKEIEIPQWQQDAVLKRMKESNKNPDRLLDWEDIKNGFKVD